MTKRTDEQPEEDTERLIAEVAARVELERWLGAESYRPVSVTPAPAAEAPKPPVAARPARPTGAESTCEPVPGEDPAKRAQLDELRHNIEDCHQCPLAASRNKFVFGAGRADARLVFIGEAPGAEEDRRGEPFVGRAGKLLTDMINAMGLTRRDVYIGNILKCRPPSNRTPTVVEMAVCLPYIIQQIQIIQPQVICALGATALKGLLRDPKASIGRMRGTFVEWRGIKMMPTYHPAYLLRSPGEKRKTWADLQKVMDELGLTGPKRDQHG